ncbi:hypothetical protein BA893_03300 [Vibrio natriegens]|uniref:hypothetical protein n=1 Tax=Vibrio natriegens TaxID=691 RepID=UPI000804252B|nr:hypothetical protein [Vibrio natriegens]ANQ20753.1 hypothetical protein BA893_03300 [Vibrio natriegens]
MDSSSILENEVEVAQQSVQCTLNSWEQDVAALQKWLKNAQGLQGNPNLLEAYLKKFPKPSLPSNTSTLQSLVSAEKLHYNANLRHAIPRLALRHNWSLAGEPATGYILANSLLVRITSRGVCLENERKPQSDWETAIAEQLKQVLAHKSRSVALKNLKQALSLLRRGHERQWSLSLIEPLWRGLMTSHLAEYPISQLRLALWEIHSDQRDTYHLAPSNKQSLGWLFPGLGDRLTTFEQVVFKVKVPIA